jgi:hypothetical protein
MENQSPSSTKLSNIYGLRALSIGFILLRNLINKWPACSSFGVDL